MLNGNDNATFLQTDLEEAFRRDNGWMDVFHALGINGAEPLDKISVPVQLEFLLSTGYLDRKDPSLLQIGAAGAALAEIIIRSRSGLYNDRLQ